MGVPRWSHSPRECKAESKINQCLNISVKLAVIKWSCRGWDLRFSMIMYVSTAVSTVSCSQRVTEWKQQFTTSTLGKSFCLCTLYFFSLHISPLSFFLFHHICPPSHTHTDHHGDGRWREGLSPILWKCRQNTANALPSSPHYLTS